MKIGRIESDCFPIVPEDEGYLRATLEWFDAPVDPMSSAFLNAALELRIALLDEFLARCKDEISHLASNNNNKIQLGTRDPPCPPADHW